jgi:hypothetical protein
MSGLTARASIRDRNARHYCHERKASRRKLACLSPAWEKPLMANVSGSCVLFGSFGVLFGLP